MTIFELQKHLQEAYEKYGDIEVLMEDTDWTGVEKYHIEIFKVKVSNGIVMLSNN
ncbi:hypothetical protein [Prevotella sp. KH2C16]|uniref:hypothetical protein n=1 Tax=Prevotella sp. KH2C16 TaxID=1855325 RepID=UPI0015A60DA5|nr:hypothetical protein [Prevotella sp. KH2C16]